LATFLSASLCPLYFSPFFVLGLKEGLGGGGNKRVAKWGKDESGGFISYLASFLRPLELTSAQQLLVFWVELYLILRMWP